MNIRPSRQPLYAVLALSLTFMAGIGVPLPAHAGAANGLVELSPTPPNITQAVPPNILVTFDDSGSMASNYMGDSRPYDGGSWGGPWFCAGAIDSRVTDSSKLASFAMNGVYYNPLVTYKPPIEADGTVMPNADINLKGVWNDGIQQNRPRNSSNSGTTNFISNTWYCGQGDKKPLGNGGGPYYFQLKSGVDIGTVTNPNTTNLYTASNWEPVSVPTAQYQNWANWWAYYRTRNLMTRTSLSRVFGTLGALTADGDYGSSLRVAWQNINDADFKLDPDAIITGLLDIPGCDASATDPKTVQRAGGVTKTPSCYRTAFFNWVFEVGASGGTPDRASTIRAGKFFQRGNGNTGGTGNLKDPYWQPAVAAGADGLELACRQNFHMLVTDGYWNEGDPGLPTPYVTSQTDLTLPDGTIYSASASESRVFWDVQGKAYNSSLANIAFNYWATNLRSDLYKPALGKFVPPYIVDKTTGVVSATDAASEIYFNPVNDPANWPHLVQYMVTLGVPGLLSASVDTDCKDDTNDLCKLRRGQKTSNNSVGWPRPANNSVEAIDDTWHAALNGRGGYFNASNPQNLVDQLTNILTNISARTVPATTSALNSPVLGDGAIGFTAGYISTNWSGIFKAITANPDGTVQGDQWDAGDILTDKVKTPPSSRQILTSKEKTDGSFDTGIAFKTFSALDTGTASSGSSYVSAQTLLSTLPASVGTADTGQARVDFLRGDRSLENDTYRTRTSLLGAIINSQALFVGVPSSNYRDTWPSGSAEATAIAGDAAACATTTPTTCHTYESFVNNNLNRLPVVYIGANDGMLHAFNAKQVVTAGPPPVTGPAPKAGTEVFAYVPRSAYDNLGNLTRKSNFKFAPTVDATPITRDVFFKSAWHTILVGGLRLGGRGVYALDVTDPTAVTEANAATKVLWEFNSDTQAVAGKGDPANLGYTFGQPNVGRLANGKWVVLVPGGYFPDCSKTDKPANCQTIAAASNKFSSLFVLDAETGALIQELKTRTDITGVTSSGLSSPVLGDYNNDQIDDLAFAGDLNGNLWRFDLSNPDPTKWQAGVTLAYKPTTQGDQPITVMPRLFPDPSTNRFIVVFGTGKYLGAADNTSDSAVTQSIYGIRDRRDVTTVVHADLQAQTLAEALSTNGTTTVRGGTDNTLTAAQGGWYIDLNLSSSPGERVVVTPGAFFDTNRVIVTTLIPGTQDPCNATIGGAELVFNAATGGSGGGLSAPAGPLGWKASGISVVGGLVTNPPTGGSVPVATVIGGGKLLVPGLSLKGGGNLNIDDAIWRRRSWRELNNEQ